MTGFKLGDTVRFSAASRHGDWAKGEQGTIEKVLATPPQNQAELVVVKKDDGVSVWATSQDLIAWDQLSLFA